MHRHGGRTRYKTVTVRATYAKLVRNDDMVTFGVDVRTNEALERPVLVTPSAWRRGLA